MRGIAVVGLLVAAVGNGAQIMLDGGGSGTHSYGGPTYASNGFGGNNGSAVAVVVAIGIVVVVEEDTVVAAVAAEEGTALVAAEVAVAAVVLVVGSAMDSELVVVEEIGCYKVPIAARKSDRELPQKLLI